MDKKRLLQELNFKAIRSGGAGGQHVNKVSTKVELLFDVANSNALSNWEKERVLQKLTSRLTTEGVLRLQVDATRSQHRNKELAVHRFLQIMANALKSPKKRKPTQPTKASVEKRLKAKKIASQKKSGRKRPDLEF